MNVFLLFNLVRLKLRSASELNSAGLHNLGRPLFEYGSPQEKFDGCLRPKHSASMLPQRIEKANTGRTRSSRHYFQFPGLGASYFPTCFYSRATSSPGHFPRKLVQGSGDEISSRELPSN